MKNVRSYLSKKLLLSLTSATLLLTASGCLKEEVPADAGSDAKFDHRAVLVASLDNQATKLVSGINKVIITGDFMKNLALQNPPQPINLSDDNEVQKAVGYMIANKQDNDTYINYTPDSRICSEILAKDNPNTCMKIMQQVTVTQIPVDQTQGVVEFRVAGTKFFSMYYGETVVSAYASLDEIVAGLTKISDLKVQNGEQGFANTLPTVHKGGVQLDISSQLSISMIYASITSALDIQGVNANGEAYSVQADASQGAISGTLDSASGLGYASLKLPKVTALFSAMDSQNASHQVEVQFPGASGMISLYNSMSYIAADTLKLATPDIYVKVDGQASVHASMASTINAQLTAQAGDLSANFTDAISAQAEFNANALINSNGTISGSIAQGTQVYFSKAAQQAKVTAGSIQLSGTLDFAGSMNASVNSCIEGQQNQQMFLQTVACKF